MISSDMEELLGMHIVDLLAPRYLEAGAKNFKEVIESGHAYSELMFRHKDGSLRHWSIDAVRLSPTRFLGFVKDITERKRTEEALQEASRKLNLLSSITRHDINNQLMMLAGNLTLLENKQKDHQSDENLMKAEAAADRISAMIHFTKEYEEIGVHAPIWHNVRTLVETSSGDIPLEKIRVVNDVPSGMEVFADPLITKVFHNLVQNALQHGGCTTIRFSLEERDGDHIIICEDDGVGIPADMREKLFTQGFGKDHGLGLFLSREILAITGITIDEEGEPGKGAKFVLTVPSGGFRTT
jgi:signal transduction histidine kinase